MNEKQNRKRVDAQTKEIIIKSVTEDGAKVADIAGRYDVGPSTIHRWVKEHRESLTGLVSESEAEKIKAAYERKIRALEEENEILRKAIHVFSDIER
ncbi:transposase [Solibacillus silvestris StLB046]|uniref:Transposase n=1 Tax=Solibacillus silvestris (strain StLB046) TaxID=1002809 RepID=F2F095_SOLSS|nr:transposase [Solibacillus silvestris]BAK15205.1 transposase [Solibacillus silvestris StLB046]